MELLLTNLQSPVILFFLLGVFAGWVKSDLEIPKVMARGFALYLIAAIGIKGGMALTHEHIDISFIWLMGAGIISGLTIPVMGYFLLQRTTSLSAIDCAALAGHYGSVSLVTFIAASEFLKLSTGTMAPGHFIALLAVMESPAILTTLLLAAPHIGSTETRRRKRDIAREVFLNGTMILLLGSLFIGAMISEDEISALSPVFVTPFKGVLCFFLLDMGLNIGRRFEEVKNLDLSVFAFSLYMPFIAALLGAGICYLLGTDQATAFLFITLTASASYIAVPAALKIALPEANPAIYTLLPIGLTFPLNIIAGLPIYYFMAQQLSGL